MVYADIQDPPANDQGPTRKLGRGLSNMLFCYTEIPVVVCTVNSGEGNSTAAGYGTVKAIGRTFTRFNAGLFEVLTFPFPTNKGTYRAPLANEIPWIHGGYAEFPPELGWETKYNYVRNHPNN